jgi:sporulation protein YlmC with PRC-barrel domain
MWFHTTNFYFFKSQNLSDLKKKIVHERKNGTKLGNNSNVSLNLKKKFHDEPAIIIPLIVMIDLKWGKMWWSIS